MLTRTFQELELSQLGFGAMRLPLRLRVFGAGQFGLDKQFNIARRADGPF